MTGRPECDMADGRWQQPVFDIYHLRCAMRDAFFSILPAGHWRSGGRGAVASGAPRGIPSRRFSDPNEHDATWMAHGAAGREPGPTSRGGQRPGLAFARLGLAGQRYSPLTQIAVANVAKLEAAWTFDTEGALAAGDASRGRWPDAAAQESPLQRAVAVHAAAAEAGDLARGVDVAERRRRRPRARARTGRSAGRPASCA